MTLTPEQQAAYQADVDQAVAELRIPEARGKVREFCGWTDESTGEEFPPYWVAEVRLGRGAGSPIIVLNIEEPQDDREDWVEVLRDELCVARILWRRWQRQAMPR